jgi:hypothetical protein
MTPVDLRVPPSLVPPGSRAIVIAEHQDEYQDLPSVRTPNGQVITRWALTDEEWRALLAGEDVYLRIWARGAILPVALSVGPCEWSGPV